MCETSGSKIVITYVDSHAFDKERVREICGDGGEQTLEMIKTVKKK